MIKYIRILENIYCAFYIHSDILDHAELPSLVKAEQRISNADTLVKNARESANYNCAVFLAGRVAIFSGLVANLYSEKFSKLICHL